MLNRPEAKLLRQRERQFRLTLLRMYQKKHGGPQPPGGPPNQYPGPQDPVRIQQCVKRSRNTRKQLMLAILAIHLINILVRNKETNMVTGGPVTQGDVQRPSIQEDC